ncbi:hypothetical protein ACIQXF_03025 [Lysinibacillus sp. NPDC097231]|uniref:hypothetical protein n=1 Tax=Lysinibacillus sp. NPDC097231 TaxID=3364142 RepID=UPI0038041069
MNYFDSGFVGKQHNPLNDAYNTAKIKFDQNPFNKLICHLYNKCKMCNETKYYQYFSKKDSRYKNICLDCAAEKSRLKKERSELRRIQSVNQ